MGNAELMCELVDGLHRLLHQPLGGGDFLGDARISGDHLRFQSEQAHVDAEQGLADVVMEMEAHLLALRLVCGHDFARHVLELLLDQAGFAKELAGGALAVLQRGLGGNAFGDALLEVTIGICEIEGALTEAFLELLQMCSQFLGLIHLIATVLKPSHP